MQHHLPGQEFDVLGDVLKQVFRKHAEVLRRFIRQGQARISKIAFLKTHVIWVWGNAC